MIAASAVLVVAALVLLIVGVFQDGLELVFGSIAASIVAAISLFLGVLRDRREPVTAPGYPAQGASAGGALPIETDEAPASPLDEEIPQPSDAPATTGVGPGYALDEAPPLILPDDDELEVPPAPAPAPAAKKSAKKPAAKKKTAAKKPAAKKKTAAKKPAAKKKTAAKKPAAKKKTAAKKPAAKKTAAKKSTAKKSAAKKTS